MKSPRAQLLVDWLEHRTGLVQFTYELLYENVPGGARWRYVWGHTLVFTFFMQIVTGVSLWMNYSPGSQSAWESVFYIQHQLQGGWLLRGLHHYTAQAMVVLLVIHLVQVVIDGAYRAPREFNFWIGLILLQLILAMGLTGYLLPWDQRGYRATAVSTNLMGIVPVAGPILQRMVIGGSEFGNLTLTRFFALHAGLLPGLVIFFIVLHFYMFRRHGLKHKTPLRSRDNYNWPDQVLKNFIACAAVLVGVLILVFHGIVTSDYKIDIAHAHLGAELGAPADPSHQFAAARPEWYFLFLFQLLKYFPGEREIWGAIVLPGAIFTFLALMPIIGRNIWGHRLNVLIVFLLLAGVATLTSIALWTDYRGPDSGEFLKAVADAREESERAAELASAPSGIPPTGAISLMRNDPKIEGRRLNGQHCASCHDKPGPTGESDQNALDAAPTLVNFASRAWIAGMLDPKRVAGPDYFGRTAHHAGEMSEFVQGDMAKWAAKDVEDVVIALSAEAHLRSQATQDATDAERIAAGRVILADADRCGQCHKFHDANSAAEAPDLTDYGSREWLIGMISNPAAKRYYGEKNDRMPAFAEHPAGSPQNRLSIEQIGILADWLRHDWYEAKRD
jgi:ubiquinol-cytochrome c reductase cytochrome b subunit